MNDIKPDFSNPLLINKTNATVTVAGCPRPENALAGETNPKITKTDSINSATASYLHLLQMNKKNKIKINMYIIIWSGKLFFYLIIKYFFVLLK